MHIYVLIIITKCHCVEFISPFCHDSLIIRDDCFDIFPINNLVRVLKMYVSCYHLNDAKSNYNIQLECEYNFASI